MDLLYSGVWKGEVVDKLGWKPKVPDLSFFLWMMALGHISTNDNYGNVILLLFIAVVFLRGLGRPVITYLYTGL